MNILDVDVEEIRAQTIVSMPILNIQITIILHSLICRVLLLLLRNASVSEI